MKRLNHFAEIRMNRFAAILFTVMLLAIYPFSKSFSNNLTITNIQLGQTATTGGTVTFDLSWNNAFRHSDWFSNNWDAAWVFVKWRDCSSPLSDPFVHGTVSTTYTDHNYNVSSGSTTFQPTDRYGTPNAIDADGTGIMLRENNATNADPFSGTVSARVTLKITTLPDNGHTLDLRVYGIEMVFVPQNAFSLGDGTGAASSTNSFTSITAPANPNIFSYGVASEAAQTVYEPVSCATGCALLAAFEKGYNAFYCMKYEITQGQYANFLNAVATVAAGAHFPNQNGVNRHTIVGGGVQPQAYSASRPYRACNWLSWADASAYLAWAALRPLSELEYEKAARGTEPGFPFQKAWGWGGTTNGMGVLPAIGDISCSGCNPPEDGTETITTNVTAGAPINANSIAWTSGDAGGVTGPLRAGIFATSGTTSRVQTGMSFYGAMEMSGNVSEYYVTALFGTTQGMAEGTGVLDVASGNHTYATWPSATATSNNVIIRGGDWSTTSGQTAAAGIATNISFRPSAAVVGATRTNATGGRGGR